MANVKATAESTGDLLSARLLIEDTIANEKARRFMVGGPHKRTSSKVALEPGEYSVSVSVTAAPGTSWKATVEIEGSDSQSDDSTVDNTGVDFITLRVTVN
jgi:hypothetical protein